MREIETVAEREKILGLYQQHRKRLSDQPAGNPAAFASAVWPQHVGLQPAGHDSVHAGLRRQPCPDLLDPQSGRWRAGRYVRGHGGGMNIVDDRHGFRPAGTEPWVNSGLIDKGKVLPLSILERQACYFMFSEPAAICQNIFLATEAMGLGGWMHCGFLSLEIMQAMGFRMADPTGAASFANPVGLEGVLEGYCPPYYPTMDAAVDAVVARMMRDGDATAATAAEPAGSPQDGRCGIRDGMFEVSDEGIACAKAVCNYIYETYGRFPASVDTMHLMWFMQAHHLDLDYYAKFFHPGACSPRISNTCAFGTRTSPLDRARPPTLASARSSD